jgi:hypothetical protein
MKYDVAYVDITKSILAQFVRIFGAIARRTKRVICRQREVENDSPWIRVADKQ